MTPFDQILRYEPNRFVDSPYHLQNDQESKCARFTAMLRPLPLLTLCEDEEGRSDRKIWYTVWTSMTLASEASWKIRSGKLSTECPILQVKGNEFVIHHEPG